MEKGTLEPIERETKFTLFRVNALQVGQLTFLLFESRKTILSFIINNFKSTKDHLITMI